MASSPTCRLKATCAALPPGQLLDLKMGEKRWEPVALPLLGSGHLLIQDPPKALCKGLEPQWRFFPWSRGGVRKCRLPHLSACLLCARVGRAGWYGREAVQGK